MMTPPAPAKNAIMQSVFAAITCKDIYKLPFQAAATPSARLPIEIANKVANRGCQRDCQESYMWQPGNLEMDSPSEAEWEGENQRRSEDRSQSCFLLEAILFQIVSFLCFACAFRVICVSRR
jgi:hypothetical protein